MNLCEDEIKYIKPEKQLFDLISGFGKRDERLKINEFEKAIILPVKPSSELKWGKGGVISEKNEFISESLHPGYFKEKENRFGGYYDYDVDKTEYIDESVIYCDPIILQWGHFLVDSISRLWYAIDSDLKVAFCGYGFPKYELTGPYIRFFELLGIKKERLIDIRKPTRFKSVIIPDLSYVADSYYSDEYKKIFRTAASNISSEIDMKVNIDKVYFTRCQFRDNGARTREIGEHFLEEIFRKNGYTVISPEKCTLDEQIYILSNCKEFASLSGTVAHNVLFAQNIRKFTILNKTSHTQRQQYYLNKISGLKTCNVDVYKEPFITFNIPKDTGYGPFILGVTDEFNLFANDSNFEMPHNKLFYLSRWMLQYIWLVFILPIRKIRFMYLKSIRGLKKILRLIGGRANETR